MMRWLLTEGLKMFVTCAAVLGILWGTLEYTDTRPVLSREFKQLAEQVYDINLSLMLQRYQYLVQKRDAGGLSPEEWYELCSLSDLLGFATQGCQ